MSTYETIIERVKEYQKKKGMSQRKFALALDIDPRVFNYYANGREMPTGVVAKILEVYEDLSAEWLFRGEGDMIKSKDVRSASVLEAENRTLLKAIEKLTKE